MKTLMTRAVLIAASLTAVVASPAAAQSSPSAYTSGTRYDVLGRVTGTIAPDPDGIGTGTLKFPAVRNSYDAAGRLVKVESGELANWKSEAVAPSAWGVDFTAYKVLDVVYDAMDHKVKESVGNGTTVQAVTQYSYDLNGRLECTAVRMNPAAYGSLPASACTLGTAGSQGPDRITRNIYDAAGQLVQKREGVGTSIEAAEATYSYTPNGKKEYVIDANGNRAQFVYDGHDRLSQWLFPSTTRPASYNDTSQATALATAGSANVADYEQYGYDANGNRTSLRKRDGSVLTYSYDALNRMTVKVVPERANLAASATRDVYYDYDLRGLMLKARFDSLAGDGITSAYNGFGDLTSSTVTMAGLTRTLSYAWDKQGHRLELTHHDGQKFTYTRDGLGRLSKLYEGTSQTTTNQLLQATFNARGMIDTLKRSTGTNGFTATHGYDGIGRLSSLANDAVLTANDLTITQSFNPASQIASQGRNNDSYSWTGAVAVNRDYATNGLNQYTSAGSAAFTYDANGNLTSDGSATFVYDIENRLVTASGSKTASLTYDPMGRLWQVVGATTNIRFLTDGDEIVAEYDSAGTLARRYVHSDNVDDPVVQYNGTAVGTTQRTFLMGDERGSIVGLFTNSGTSTAKNTYDEYGIPETNVSGTRTPGVSGRFAYTGQIWLPELGMYHYKARIYSPTLGRFLQVDPIGYDDHSNLYAYVADDPVNKTDPSGNAGEDMQEQTVVNAGLQVTAVAGFGGQANISFSLNLTNGEVGISGDASLRAGVDGGLALTGSYERPVGGSAQDNVSGSLFNDVQGSVGLVQSQLDIYRSSYDNGQNKVSGIAVSRKTKMSFSAAKQVKTNIRPQARGGASVGVIGVQGKATSAVLPAAGKRVESMKRSLGSALYKMTIGNVVDKFYKSE